MRVTAIAELQLKMNQQAWDVMNPEEKVPETWTGQPQASPAGSKGPSAPTGVALHIQSTHIHTYQHLIFRGVLSFVMMGTHM